MEIKNKKAYFNYFVEAEIESGIALTGTEIKSVRKGSVNIKDSYIRIKNNEVFIINMYIAKYENGNIFNHDEYRERKLLLHKKEIRKLNEQISQDSYTLIPLSVYLKNNKAKVLIGICKGKKVYDKRQSIKEKDILKSSYQRIS
ncbi:MAG: SsrA-binding protein SmpB [Firmicutes bacterium]|nr:SsrA-binding protein SmpB [Bacillota bacterium]